MKKKIAIIIPSLRGGGAERVITNIIRNVNRNKFDMVLVLIKKEGVFLSMIPEDVEIVDINSNRVRYSFFRLIRVINNHKPDLIFSTLGHMNLALLLIRPFFKNNPRILVREASTPSMSLLTMPKFKSSIFKFLYNFLYPKADLVIAQCNEMKDDLVENFNIAAEKIKVIYNPVDLENIKNKRELFNPYNENEVNIVAVGRLTRAKGFDTLIEAFEIVSKSIHTARLYILGDGELREYLLLKAKEKNIDNKIKILGFVENPYPYYYYSDTYVLSSRWEGFPNALLEALACGTKVVATKCKSGPKEIIENNKYGILVEVDNPESLAYGILKSLEENNKSNNRAEVFSIENIVKKYEEVFLMEMNEFKNQ